MKKVILILLCIAFVFSCNRDEEVQSLPNIETQQNLPDNVESVNVVDKSNKNLNSFLSTTNIDKQELNLDEVSIIKFKGNEGKYAFSIPIIQSDKLQSRTLFVYFKDSDFTKFNTIVHSIESVVDKKNTKSNVLTVYDYEKTWLVKKEFNDAKSQSPKNGISCVPPSFQEVDADFSSGISPEEYSYANGIFNFNKYGYSFSSLDQDNDGSLSPSEYGFTGCTQLCVICRLDDSGCTYEDILCSAAALSYCIYNCW